MTSNTLRLTLAALLLSPVLALAAVPQTVGFSARIADSGTPVTGTKSFTFKLWDALEAGNEVWTETKDLTVSNGVVTAALGDTTALPAFDGTPRWLEVTMGTATFAPRLEIQSVPYALRAGVAESVDWANVTNKPALSCVEQPGANPYTINASADGEALVVCPSGTTPTGANVYNIGLNARPVTVKTHTWCESIIFAAAAAAPAAASIPICFGTWRNGCQVVVHNFSTTATSSFEASCRCCAIQ